MLGDGYAAAERIALEPNGNPNYLSLGDDVEKSGRCKSLQMPKQQTCRKDRPEQCQLLPHDVLSVRARQLGL